MAPLRMTHPPTACPGLMQVDQNPAELGPDLIQRSKLLGMTLADAVGWTPGTAFTEEFDMQPVVMKVLQTAAAAVHCDAHHLDTHRTPVHDARTCKPDILSLAHLSDCPVWAEVVVVYELKLGTCKTEVETMVRARVVGMYVGHTNAHNQD